MEKWCDHWIWINGCWIAQQFGQGVPSNYCGLCGKPRPKEQPVSLPPRVSSIEDYGPTINQVIEYLKSEPWKK